MSIEENKALVRRFLEQVWNQGNLAFVDASYNPDYLHHDPHLPMVRTSEDYKQWVSSHLGAFPDFQVTIEELVAEGDLVVAHVILQGTNTGDFGPPALMPATGKPITVSSIIFARIAAGKIVEDWYQTDNLTSLQQLGMLPAME
jgi:steroid delta-isomerase-like uncharacterized protein